MKNKKAWGIFSGVGFALSASLLVDVARMKPDFFNPIAFIGLIISMIGAGIALNSVLWLSVKKGGLPLKNEGVYKFARHPMYLGGIFFVIGLWFTLIPSSLSQSILSGLSVACFFIASRLEDNFNIEKFGEDYKKYILEVSAFGFSEINQRISIFSLVLIIGSAAGIIGYSNAKIKTFEECEKSGWLVRSIIIYNGNGSIEKECILWSGQHFTKP